MSKSRRDITGQALRVTEHWPGAEGATDDGARLGLGCGAGRLRAMHSGLYDFLRDQGSLIGGLLALLAGGIAYLAGLTQARATKEASDKQIAVSAERDQSQARCLAVGIYPELLQVKITHERASKIVNEFTNQKLVMNYEQKSCLDTRG